MVKLLDEPDKDLKCLAAETIGKKKTTTFYFRQEDYISIIYI